MWLEFSGMGWGEGTVTQEIREVAGTDFVGLFKQVKKFGFYTHLYHLHANWKDLRVEMTSSDL